MKLGYPCINLSLEDAGVRTFRLKSYSAERLAETVEANLATLLRILEFNAAHGLLFFRVSSQLVPFASHPVSQHPWQAWFQRRFEEIGAGVKRHGMRISMHPDQFTLINTPDEKVLAAGIRELEYHAEVLDLMGLDATHKVQIHVGGVYGNKPESVNRFARRYEALSDGVKRRLAIENDDRLYSLADCLEIHRRTGVPVVFDAFHHRLLQADGLPVRRALEAAAATWKPEDGALMVDYSSQEPGKRPGTHAGTIDLADFQAFLDAAAGLDFDVMLEIKDKDASALKAVRLLRAAA
jgi:UV DNA damage endonuclease